MLTIKYGTQSESKQYILEKIHQEKQKNKNFRVIDIGGAAGDGWTSNIADLIVDINIKDSEKNLNVDICDHESWNKILKLVEKEGIFDYAICTHTLEDVYNPFTTLKMLPKIAKSGIITMPSIRSELSFVENLNWIGYIHHRWIFDKKDDKMQIIPKLGLLQPLCHGKKLYKKQFEEISYEWKKDIPFIVFMDNYLGPNAQTVINNYINLINEIE